jgi:hypothetical protein
LNKVSKIVDHLLFSFFFFDDNIVERIFSALDAECGEYEGVAEVVGFRESFELFDSGDYFFFREDLENLHKVREYSLFFE